MCAMHPKFVYLCAILDGFRANGVKPNGEMTIVPPMGPTNFLMLLLPPAHSLSSPTGAGAPPSRSCLVARMTARPARPLWHTRARRSSPQRRTPARLVQPRRQCPLPSVCAWRRRSRTSRPSSLAATSCAGSWWASSRARWRRGQRRHEAFPEVEEDRALERGQNSHLHMWVPHVRWVEPLSSNRIHPKWHTGKRTLGACHTGI
jgi:hypothetical protein